MGRDSSQAPRYCPACGTEQDAAQRFCPRCGSTLPRTPALLPGKLAGMVVADRYHLLGKLGEGGLGEVYLAEHVKLHRKSALRVLHPEMVHDADAIARFNRAAANASRINHPHVAAIHDFGRTDDGLVYLATEYVEGEPLSAVIAREGSLPAPRAAAIARQVAEALGAAHELGVVHAALTPGSIMLARNRDGSDHVKVVDFGMSRIAAPSDRNVTRTGVVTGTPEYLSPEQIAGAATDARSDIYALGLVAFQLLSGRPAFAPGETPLAAMLARLTNPPRTLGEVAPDVAWPPAAERVVAKALARDAQDRYESAAEFGRELVGALGTSGAAIAAPPLTEQFGRTAVLRPPPPVVPAPGPAPGTAPVPMTVSRAPRRRVGSVLGGALAAVVGAPVAAAAYLIEKLRARNEVPSRAEPGASTVPAPEAASAPTAAPAPTLAPAGDEGTSILRHPSITPGGAAVAGQPLTLTIDLTRELVDAATQSSGVFIAGLPASWEELPVTVQLSAPDLAFDGADGESCTVVVRRNAPSVPGVVRARVRDEASGREAIDVIASFFHDGRFCGMARRAIPLVAAAAAAAAASLPGPSGRKAAAGTVVLDIGAAQPLLTILILPHPDSEREFHWILRVGDRECPGLPEQLHDWCTVGDDTPHVVRDLFADCAASAPGEHMALMDGVGTLLYDLAPRAFKQAYWALRERHGPGFPIQFVTAEPHLPWELMRPHDRASGRTAGILAVEHPVGRWIADYEGTMPSRLPAGAVVTVAPDYTGRANVPPLPAAQAESELLVREYGATAVRPARKADVLDLLAGGGGVPIALLHFAGHGEFGLGTAARSRLLLADRDLLLLEVRRSETRLGREQRTVVILNACEAGATGAVLGMIGGWAEAFLNAGFGGFLAPLWAVQDDDARTLTEELLDGALRRHEPVGAVVRDIRARHGARSPTFLSYLYYGDVMARFA